MRKVVSVLLMFLLLINVLFLDLEQRQILRRKRHSKNVI